MTSAALKAARGLVRDFGEVEQLQVSIKGPGEFVSTADLKAERTLRNELHRARPGYGLLFEEGGEVAGGDPRHRWIVDPLDGTTNFLHGFPWYAVSIAALVDGELRAGVVLNAANGELFTATAGGGARRSGEPITVSSIADPQRALIGTGFPFKDARHIDRYLATLPELMREVAGVRRPGSAALDLADVACGRFDAFWELSLAPWDIAAGILLIREAGGVITDLEGQPAPVEHTGIVAGNPEMHRWLFERVNR